MIRHLLILSAVSALALTGCAGKTRPPAISYDPASFHVAKLEADPPMPVRIVAVPQPLPLPGQLQPPPSVKRDERPPTARVDAANRAATREPSTSSYINAVQVYPWSDGALYRLYAAPEHVTDVALQPGEQLVAVSAGDTVRWVTGDTSSGTGESRQAHVLVKPFAPGGPANRHQAAQCPAHPQGAPRLAAARDRPQGPRLSEAMERADPRRCVMAELKLPRLPDRRPVKIAISVTPDLDVALRDYLALYRAAYGDTAATAADLIPAMLEAFLNSDRAFKARKSPVRDG